MKNLHIQVKVFISHNEVMEYFLIGLARPGIDQQ